MDSTPRRRRENKVVKPPARCRRARHSGSRGLAHGDAPSTRPDGNRVFVAESCRTDAFLQPRPACGMVMTRESRCRGVTFGGAEDRRMGPFAADARGRRVDTDDGLARMLESVKLTAEYGQQVRASTEPTRNGPTRSRVQARNNIARSPNPRRAPAPPTRPITAGAAARRNTGTTCFRVPTSRPSSDDPPRFGASGAARWPIRLYCRTNGCASILELHPEGGIAVCPRLRLLHAASTDPVAGRPRTSGLARLIARRGLTSPDRAAVKLAAVTEPSHLPGSTPAPRPDAARARARDLRRAPSADARSCTSAPARASSTACP